MWKSIKFFIDLYRFFIPPLLALGILKEFFGTNDGLNKFMYLFNYFIGQHVLSPVHLTMHMMYTKD